MKYSPLLCDCLSVGSVSYVRSARSSIIGQFVLSASAIRAFFVFFSFERSLLQRERASESESEKARERERESERGRGTEKERDR